MRKCLAGTLLLLSVMMAAPAGAQDDPRKAEAQRVLDEAMRLHDANRDAEALPLFRRAYEIFPSPNALFNVARAEQLTGARAQALRHYRECLKNPLLNPAFHGVAVERVRELEAALAHLRLTAPEGAKVTVDGEPVESLHAPYAVEPGARTIAVVDGERRTIEVAAGQTLDVDLRVAQLSTTEPPAEVRSSGSGQTTRWIVVGTASVLTVTAATLAVIFEANRADAKSRAETIFPGCRRPAARATRRRRARATTTHARTAANTNRARVRRLRGGLGRRCSGRAPLVAEGRS